jgi:uncharacterized membrane protein YjgN (DUF898 family)
MPPESEARSFSGVPSSISTGPWPIEFRGRGSELFVIHFVNGLLNLFTLGVWYAWGRVRELRFLIGSTWVAGDPMSFHGRGGELFRGVLIAFFAFIVPLYALFVVASRLTGALSALLMLAAFLGFGLLVAFASVGALRYRLPRTEWRGIRFGFDGNRLEFLGGFVWRAALVAITLGFYHPIYSCWRRKWMLSHTRFGTEFFDCDAEPALLYRPFAVCWLLSVVTFGLSWAWYQGYLQGFLWNRSRLGSSRFTSTMTGGGWLKFQLVNALLMLGTFGMAASWIITRTHSFFFSHLTLDGALDLAAIKQRLQTTSGIGEGALDVLDLDSGLDLG